jgi:FAD/FMN-containing dehydrogenase
MSDTLLSDIRTLVGEAVLLTGDAINGRSAGIWSAAPLEALALVRPASTDEVAGVLRLCHAA